MALKTEQNTTTMEKHVRSAAFAARLAPRGRLQTDFEHGQWWATNLNTGAQWSVVDSNPGYGIGFDFEQITQGEE